MPPLVDVTRDVVPELAELEFDDPVACIYNPLDYAWDLHRQWLERYGRGPKRYLLVGMNPGPFGMVQTGVPFGEVEAVRSWLGLRGEVRQPRRTHEKRPVEGLACRRSEVSGKRLWGWAAARFVTPNRFFRHFFVHNYCPLAFVGASGANLTPDKLPKARTAPLFALCDRLLRRVVAELRPQLVIGVGAFAEERARKVLVQEAAGGLGFGRIPHPSPASPAANRGWESLMDQALQELGVAV
ncbi:MAG: single-stranded DNA-binding protein [Planctomycetes bacterium]|nr:single-stranded DNA-binding protein [Planctomycetota bacterium]